MHYMKQRGWTNQQIAAFTGHHRDTVARVLRESLEKEPARRQRRALAAAFEVQIQQWLDERLSVQRMIELARADTAHPFTGSDVAFYNFVRPLRKARQTQTPSGRRRWRWCGLRGCLANSCKSTGVSSARCSLASRR